MKFFTYIIACKAKNKLTTYVGYTNNINKRIRLHNEGKGAKFTKGRKWKLIYSEKFKTKKEALSREYFIKKDRKFRNNIKKRFINEN